MRCAKILLLILAVCSITLPSHASIVPFNISIALQSGGSVSGFVDVDTVQGVFTGADFTVLSNGVDYVFDFAPTFQGNGFGPNYYYGDWEVHSSPTVVDYEFQLALPGNSLVGFTGSPICSTSSECTVPNGFLPTEFVLFDPSEDLAVSGSVTPTPEPSSLALLGTGILAFAAVARKRFA